MLHLFLDLILKFLLITFKAQTISDILSPYEALCSLRSSGGTLLVVPKLRLWKSKSDQAFPIRAPHFWNDLPEQISLGDRVTLFKSLLNTYFYLNLIENIFFQYF